MRAPAGLNRMSSAAAVKVWIWLSVFATCVGWTLSFFGYLRLVGYLVLTVVTYIAFSELRNRGLIERGNVKFNWSWAKLRQRFRRPIPLAFLVLAALALLGGILYPPTNHTGLSYRVPRVLNWLDAGQWHWIYAPNIRMNTRTCGIEWLSAPLLLLFKSDRFLFLLNFIPYLIVPGLLFSMLRRLGVAARVAWQWMWIFPTGYVLLLQAGSIGNDAFPVIYAIAAIDFAARAWSSRRASDLWYSGLAVALLTGAKASNLTLCLMWLVLVAPLWRILREKPIGTTVVIVLMILVSAIPTILMNLYYCGDWSGLKIEKPGMSLTNPFVGLWGNPVLLLLNNLCPPVFPMAGWWNQHILEHLPNFIVQPLKNNFEWPFHQLWEIPTEDWAGIGPGVTTLMLVAGGATVLAWFRSRKWPAAPQAIPPLIWKLTLLSAWIGLAAYCVKSGMVTPGRLIAPYYPLLLPALLLGAGQIALLRTRIWRGLVWLTFVSALAVLVVTPPRPLWPAKTILTRLHSSQPDQKLIERALATYTAYSIRNDPLAELRTHLPADLKVVGMVAGPDDLDISLWRPFGTRKVAHISALATNDSQVTALKLSYAVVSDLHLQFEKVDLAQWTNYTKAQIVTNVVTTINVSSGPQIFYVVRFPTNAPPPFQR